VWPEDEGASGEGNGVAEHVFHGVGVLGADPGGLFVLVVDLVNVLVEETVVKQPMAPVPKGVLCQHTEGELPQDGPKGGHRIRQVHVAPLEVGVKGYEPRNLATKGGVSSD